MPIVAKNILNDIRGVAASNNDRVTRARRLAELIQKIGDYRWVGVYDVGAEFVSLLAFCGPSASEYPKFKVGEGLTGAAVNSRQPVIVGDVTKDPRYVTAFGDTLSEMIVPVLAPGGDRVLGTVDVVSDRLNAFSASDREVVEHCASAALPLWLLQ